MSYHISFLSPRFNLAFLISDTQITEYNGQKWITRDGVPKVYRISNFAWLSCIGFQPFGWSYRDWLKKLWNEDIQNPKANTAFLGGAAFLAQSRRFSQAALNRLKRDLQKQGSPIMEENIHMILGGISETDAPFFAAINNGGGESFSHTLALASDGELPSVFPAAEENVLDWVRNGLLAIQQIQSSINEKGEFVRRVQRISAQVFKEISRSMADVSSLCDIVVISPDGSQIERFKADQSFKEMS